MSAVSQQRRTFAIQNRFNPIRGLTPQKLTQQLDSFRLGFLRECAVLWEAMIRRDPLLRNVASKRYKAVARAQWEILTVDDSPEALLQKKVLEKFYNNLTATDVLDENEVGGFGLLLRMMMSAMGLRYAAFEIVWKRIEGVGRQIGMQQRRRSASRPDSAEMSTEETGSGGPDDATGATNLNFITAEFRKVPLEFFENRTGRLQFLESDFALEGHPLEPGGWMVCVGDGIMEATSVAYMYKHMALKDWLACSEGFGSPIPWGQTEAPYKSEQWNQMETALSQMMAQRSILTSRGEDIKLIEMGAAANLPFPPLVELMDRAIASLWRGADLSTISQGQAGIGASLQGEESDLLLEDDAKWLAEQLWNQVDGPVLQYALGVTDPLAYVSILPPKRKNVAQDIQIDEFLMSGGFPLSQDDAAERYGRAVAEPGESLLEAVQLAAGASSADGGPTRTGQTTNLPNTADAQRLRAAKRKLMGPVFKELRRIESLPDGPQQRAALVSLMAELPALKARLENEAGAGEVADVLAEEMKKALVDGLKTQRRKGAKTQ